MKTIRQGVLPAAPVLAWWIGKEASCQHCGARVELEAGDDTATPNPPSLKAPVITVHAERHPGGKQWVEGQCPTENCPGKLELTNVWPPHPLGPEFDPEPAKPLKGAR